jgi:hypothetical protein
MVLPSRFGRQLTTNRLAALLLIVVPLVYFIPAVRGKIVLAPEDGLIFNVPLRVAAANIFLSGHLPLWNPYIFSGMPLHASAQGGLLFPLNWAYLLCSAPLATNLMVIATYALAGLGAFFCARRAGATVAGALVTGLCWQWSGFLINQIAHINVVHTAALLPWVIWAVDGYGNSAATRRGVLLAALVAVQVFAGHQQTFAYSLLLTVAYALTMAVWSREKRKAYLTSLVFMAAGVLLAAVQILPTFELLRNSYRASADYDFFTSFSMEPRFVWTVVAPYLMGGGDGRLFRAHYIGPGFYSEYVVYIGVLGFMLALLAVWRSRDARTCFWVIVAIVGLVLAFGRYAPFGLYRALYYVPMLNLFRVHARHLMEVNFALAMLAGLGFSTLRSRSTEKVPREVLIIGAAVIVITVLAVTVGRPTNFTLGRHAPVSIMRAPELFMPIAIALISFWAVWRVANRQKYANAGALVILVLDLALWGQFSGWRVMSPEFRSELWNSPDTIQFLRANVNGPSRILTQDQPFDPATPVPSPSPDKGWVATLQPNIFMMYGIENAAGYDGFGLDRYSRLAGDMKVWGELSDPERTLRSSSRELDVLNVRYLLTRPMPLHGGDASKADAKPDVSSNAEKFPPATRSFGGQKFSAVDLKLPSLTPGKRLRFIVSPVEADRLALLTNASWSVGLPNGTAIARVTLRAVDQKTLTYDLRLGFDTSEWAYDRPDLRSKIKSDRAPVATSYPVLDAQVQYDAHTYVSVFKLPEKSAIEAGEIEVLPLENAPDLTLGVFSISLQNGDSGLPVSPELIRKIGQGEPPLSGGQRWQKVAALNRVVVFRNTRALPRAWLASNAVTLADDEILGTIRSGTLPDGRAWDPRATALIETPAEQLNKLIDDPAAIANVLRSEPNRIVVSTKSTNDSILVLSENFYPGWYAKVDGQAASIVRVDYSLRGVALKPGEHTVEFVYRPNSVLIGGVISLATLGFLIVPLVRKR